MYQFLLIFLLTHQLFYIVVCGYGGYGASLIRDNTPERSKTIEKPYYHSGNEYENRNHEFWYENKPMPHYHGSAPIIIHQHFTEEENFIDDHSYVTDPPGFSLQKYKQESYQRLAGGRNNNYMPSQSSQFPSPKQRLGGSGYFNDREKSTQQDQFPEPRFGGLGYFNEREKNTQQNQFSKPRIGGSENMNHKEKITQPNLTNNKLTKSEEKLLKEIEDEISMEDKSTAKSSNGIIEDITGNGESNKGGKVSTNPTGTSVSTDKSKENNIVYGKLPPGTQPDPLPHLPSIPPSSNTYFGDEEKMGEEHRGGFGGEEKKGDKYKSTFDSRGQKGKANKITFENEINIIDQNNDKNGGKGYKSVFENEVNISEQDTDKNKGTDYMDDLDKMSTSDVEKLPSTTTKYTSTEKTINSDYDLISHDNKKTKYEKEDNELFEMTSDKNKFQSTSNIEKVKSLEKNVEGEDYQTTDMFKSQSTSNIEEMRSLEKNSGNSGFYRPFTKEGGKKKCCACCGPLVSTKQISPKTEFIQYINQNPPKPPPIVQSNYVSSPYIPTGAELAAKYGVPYPSMVSQGQSCGVPSIPCIPIPYIPPPCCIIPPPRCCLPTIPCCPKVQVSCCPQTPICCQPNQNYLQQPRTSCGTCKSKTLIKLRSKRNTCLPCKLTKRSKRSDIKEVDQHHRVKRLGCIPCLQRRVKRTPINSNCQTCFGNGNTRSKRSLNCTLCKGTTSSSSLLNLNRHKRDTHYDSPGYDNIFNCDKSCCDYSKCNEFTAKPLQSKKKKLN